MNAIRLDSLKSEYLGFWTFKVLTERIETNLSQRSTILLTKGPTRGVHNKGSTRKFP